MPLDAFPQPLFLPARTVSDSGQENLQPNTNRRGSGDSVGGSGPPTPRSGGSATHCTPTGEGLQRGAAAASQSGGSGTSFSSLGSSILSASQLAERRHLGAGGARSYRGASVANAEAGREQGSGSSSRSESSKQVREEEVQEQIKRARADWPVEGLVKGRALLRAEADEKRKQITAHNAEKMHTIKCILLKNKRKAPCDTPAGRDQRACSKCCGPDWREALQHRKAIYRAGRVPPGRTKAVENGDVAQIGGSEDRLRELAQAYLQDCDG